MDEHVEAWSVEQIDFFFLWFFVCIFTTLDKSEPRGNRHLSSYFFFVIVGNGRTVVDATEARSSSGSVEHGGHQRGLSGMPVPDQGKVAEIGCFVHFHGLSPSAGFREG